jgi:rhodanese-related sulfurtransferase
MNTLENNEITPQELKELLQEKNDIILLDVRQTNEYEICHIRGSTSMPFETIPHEIDQFSYDDNIITICHHGVRSLNACMQLKKMGYKNVRSLKGGLEDWAQICDPTMKRY